MGSNKHKQLHFESVKMNRKDMSGTIIGVCCQWRQVTLMAMTPHCRHRNNYSHSNYSSLTGMIVLFGWNRLHEVKVSISNFQTDTKFRQHRPIETRSFLGEIDTVIRLVNYCVVSSSITRTTVVVSWGRHVCTHSSMTDMILINE